MNECGIYLFTGPELGEKNEAIENIRQMIAKKNGPLDEYKYYVSDVRIQDIISQLQSTGLFVSSAFIVLKNAELIKTKGDIELISDWAKNSPSTINTLILVSDENSVDKKLDAAVPANHKKIFWEMFENRKSQWVMGYFRRNGFSVKEDAVEQILEMVENNTESLRSECSKFFNCFEKNHVITCEDVDKILSHNREENAFTLFEALIDGSRNNVQRLESALEILQKIRMTKDSSGVMLIAGLSYCFRQLKSWHKLNGGYVKPSETQLKAAGFMGKKNRDRYEGASKVYSAPVTDAILSLLSVTDMSIRTEGSAFEDTRLSMMLYSIVMKNGEECSVYEPDFPV